MGKATGGPGKGETKGPAWHAANLQKLGGKKEKSKPPRDNSLQDKPEVVATTSIEDVVSGISAVGHTLQTEGALFTLGEGADRFLLTQATDSVLAKFATEHMANIHIFLWGLTKSEEEFNPLLSGEFGEKQRAMHAHLRIAFGEENIAALAARLKKDREDLLRLQAEQAPKWAGNKPEVWEDALADIGMAFERMMADKPAMIRVGPNEPSFGVVLRIDARWRTGGLSIFVDHVGEKSPLVEKIPFGASLWCQNGTVPLQLHSAVANCPNGPGIEALRAFILALDNQKDKVLVGIADAFKRIDDAYRRPRLVPPPAPQVKPSASKMEVPVAALLQPAKPEAQPVPVPAAQPVVHVQQPAPHVPRRQQQAQHAPATNPKAVKPASGLAIMLATLMANGASDTEIGDAVVAYNTAMAMTKSA